MTFYFYDLETSSGSPRTGRIMQFAGQRTNENLEPIGDPDNILVKLADDVLPEPEAILVHGITPQQTLSDGISEADFAEIFFNKIAESNTVFIGYNNIRFDDEFMRALAFRNFYEPYEWHWKDGRGRWDLLDPMRMMRALRPEGIKWPTIEGKPTVKLEQLAKANNITHDNAHDALSDVQALIDLAVLYKKSQPKLFSYLIGNRDKKAVAKIAEKGEPFVYTSGKYDSEFNKTTVVWNCFSHPRRDGAIVYDLRYDPTEWIKLEPVKLTEHWSAKYGSDIKQLPVKTIQYNRCPAIAPFSVLDNESKKRIEYSSDFDKNLEILKKNPEFINKLKTALDILEKEQQSRLPLDDEVDNKLYDEFWNDKDKAEMLKIRHSEVSVFEELQREIKNKRLRDMMPLYKARNYPNKLSADEHEFWELRKRRLFMSGGENSQLSKIFNRIQAIHKTRALSKNEEYLLSELQLYIESILP